MRDVQIIEPSPSDGTLVVDGWSVPLVGVMGGDHGFVTFVVGGGLGYNVPVGEFEEVANLLADAIAIALGLPSHPRGDLSEADHALYFRCVRHPALAPRRVCFIEGVRHAVAPEPPDDPRSDS